MQSNSWLRDWLPAGHDTTLRYMLPGNMEKWAIANAAKCYTQAVAGLAGTMLDQGDGGEDAAKDAAVTAAVLDQYLSDIGRYADTSTHDDDEEEDDDDYQEGEDLTPEVLSTRSQLTGAKTTADDLARRVRQRLAELKLPEKPQREFTVDTTDMQEATRLYRNREMAAEHAATVGNAAAMEWLLNQLLEETEPDHDAHRSGAIVLAMAPHEHYLMRTKKNPKAREQAEGAWNSFLSDLWRIEEHRPTFVSHRAKGLLTQREIDDIIAEIHGVGADSDPTHDWNDDNPEDAVMAYRHQGSNHVKLIAEAYDHPIDSDVALAHCNKLEDTIFGLWDPETEEGPETQATRTIITANAANRTLAILHYHYQPQALMDLALRIAKMYGGRAVARNLAVEIYDHQAEAVNAALERTGLDEPPLNAEQALGALEAAKAAGASDDALRQTAELLGLMPEETGLPQPAPIPWEWTQEIFQRIFDNGNPPPLDRWERVAQATGWPADHDNLRDLARAMAGVDQFDMDDDDL